MSTRGLCSRREADDLITRGCVSVDGIVIDVLGTRVQPDCVITLNDQGTHLTENKITIILNKPVGYLSTPENSPKKGKGKYRSAISLFIPSKRYRHDKFPMEYSRTQRMGLAPAGRLDIESQGLLVLTQNGRIARQLIAPGSRIEKEYLVRVKGKINQIILDKLSFGMVLDGRQLKRAEVKQINPDQLRFILTEGRKRQIRRMCAAVDLQVTGLKRVRIGKIKLAGLPEGQWRYLAESEKF